MDKYRRFIEDEGTDADPDYKDDEVSSSDSNALLSAAASACVDIYMDIHVSEMRGKPEHLKKAWSVGQEIYIAKNKGR